MNLLCSSALARHPFVIPALNLRIYSGEELCYFMYHNPALLEEPVISEELLHFIDEELRLPGSAARLERFRSSRDWVVEVMAVMREFAYYPEETLRQFQKILERQQKKPAFAREMDRADALAGCGRFRAALNVYVRLLAKTDSPDCTAEVYAAIGFRMAYANCGLGLYSRAAECLREAYIRHPDADLARFAWEIEKLGGCKEGGSGAGEWSGLLTEEQQWEREYEALERQVREEEKSGELAMIASLDSIRRREALVRYVEKQKAACRENIETVPAETA